MLHRPERVHRQVLLGAAGAAEPTVVRHVHHHARTVVHELTKEIGEDAFVTDDDAERGWRTREHHGPGAGLQLGNELRPAPDEPNHSRKRHVFSEWNEVNFIIPTDDPPLGDDEGGVAQTRRLAVQHVDGADQQRRLQLARQGGQRAEQPGIAPQHGGGGRLRPHDEIGARGAGLTRQLEIDL